MENVIDFVRLDGKTKLTRLTLLKVYRRLGYERFYQKIAIASVMLLVVLGIVTLFSWNSYISQEVAILHQFNPVH